MSTQWMAEMAELVDAAADATVQAAHRRSSTSSPPVIQETPAVPIAVDDPPTEPATSPRHVDPQVQEWPVELQLPTREYGPHPEPEVYPCRFLMNDGQWSEAEREAHLHKAAQATNLHVWNREARAEPERHN